MGLQKIRRDQSDLADPYAYGSAQYLVSGAQQGFVDYVADEEALSSLWPLPWPW